MLVPLNTLVATVDEIHEDVMSEPGAYTSTTIPKLLNHDLASVFIVEPTVMAEGSDAGEVSLASTLLFPAATTMTTPFDTAFATAAFIVLLLPPPRLMLATHNPRSSPHFFTT
jgi:hypothetical protein